MKQVKKSVLLWYSPHQMFSLVADVARYPEFLPWCSGTEVLEQREDGLTARVGLSFSGIKNTFTTRNTHVPDQSVTMKLVDGPFSQLDGLWQFKPLASPDACRVEFELSYAFSNRALELVISPVFGRIADTFVDSFVQRAESVYAAR